jgi:hypothetical protein
MKRIALAVLIWAIAGSASPPGEIPPSVVATPISLDPDDAAHDRFGGVRYLGGWQLASAEPRFGGYSALSFKDGQFLALADTGEYLAFRMIASGAIEAAHFGELPGFPGDGQSKTDRDSESMTIDPTTRQIWVGFEQHNAVFRYAPNFAGVLSQRRPAEMHEWPANFGPESMVRMSDGRFVILSENAMMAGGVKQALLFPGDPTDARNVPIAFGYRPPPGYLASDAAQLPDGRLIVLNRHFTMMDGFWATLTIIDPRAIRSGAIVTGERIAEFRRPLNIDNMEGISVAREGGRTILWIISDDNQLPIERTLLLKFALEGR